MSTGLPPDLSASRSPALPAVPGESAGPQTAQVSTGQASQVDPGQAAVASDSLARQLKWFVQQVSTLQGQLPPSAQDVQQQLLRQLADVLTRSPLPAFNNLLAPAAQQNLQQWLGAMATGNTAVSLPAASGSWLAGLVSQPPDTSALGRTLLQWTTQLVLSRWPQQLQPSASMPNPAQLPAALQWPQQPPTGREQVALETALATTLRFLQASQTLDTATGQPSLRMPDSPGNAGNSATNGERAAASAPTSSTHGSSLPARSTTARTTDSNMHSDTASANTYLRPLRTLVSDLVATTTGTATLTTAEDTPPESGKADTPPPRSPATATSADKLTTSADKLATRAEQASPGAAPATTAQRDGAMNEATAEKRGPAQPALTPSPDKTEIGTPPAASEKSTLPVTSGAGTPQQGATVDASAAQTGTLRTAASQPWVPPPNMPGSMPLGDYLHQLGTLLAKRNLPDTLRPALQQIDKIFTTPLTQGPQIEEWFSFLRQPLFGDSGQSKALLQWGIALLTYRLQQLGTQNPATGQAANAPLPAMPREEEATGHWARNATGQLAQQAERLSPSPADTPPWLIPHLPLPPHYSGGRGGQLSLRKQQGKENQTQWVLNFILEPEQLGPIRIKAFLDLPAIRLQTVAERAQTVDRLRESLPLLEARLRDLGLQPEPSQCRQEKVNMAEEVQPAPNEGFSVRI